MHGPAVIPDLDLPLDILGQQPLLKIYTQICLCFSVADASSHTHIVDTLQKGLERLSANFPWVAGQVVEEGSEGGNAGIFKIKPLERIPRLIVKDLRHDPSIPTMDALRQANFPFSMLDESIIAPRKTLPGGSDDEDETYPVFLVQATFITGGLLLTFVGEHNAMDMTGQGQVIHILSKACHNEQFTGEELSTGNLDRRDLVPLLDDSYKECSELARQVAKHTPPSHLDANGTNGDPAAPFPPPKSTWAYFTFPHISLTALKSLATQTITLPSGYISTDDALSAFIWQSVIRARLPRREPTSESTLARAVDVRRYIGVPQTYPGLLQNMTYHTNSLRQLVTEPLGVVASQLRLAVDPKTSNLGYCTRALATLLSHTSDKASVSFTATLDLSADLMISSWAKVDCYNLDFNLGLGKPEAVRRPRFEPFESLIYLMPRALDGEIAVAICLRDEDLGRLRADEEFGKYGKYIG
ncbi:hypothetical protein HK102_004215 [Quaeritorhiza haematococci]|nr:hypothetical protein HK102_004215 [Quaeritorhiza haematococci]